MFKNVTLYNKEKYNIDAETIILNKRLKERKGPGEKSRIKIDHVQVQTHYDDYNHYVCLNCTNKQ